MEENIINKIFLQNCGDSLLVLEKTNQKDKSNSFLYRCQFQKYPYEVFKSSKEIKGKHVLNPQIEKVEFINKIWPQKCGDSLKIIKKSEKIGGYWECEFIKYPYQIIKKKLEITKGIVLNPKIEEEEFINKIWPQNCGDSLKILEKSNILNSKNGTNKKWKCIFIKYPYTIYAEKSVIQKGNVLNPKIEEQEMYSKLWLQHCGDSLKIIEKTRQQEKNSHSFLYKAQFIKYPYIIYRTKQDIQKGICLNPEIERIEFLDKIWHQNCGDDLKILGKIIKNKKSYYKCEFIKYPYQIICDKKDSIICGRIINPNLPYKSREGIIKIILENFPKGYKPTYLELSKKLGIGEVYTNQLILKYNLKSFVKFSISNQEKEFYFYIKSLTTYKIDENNFKVLNGKEIDVYISDLKLGFEYNGNLWHSNHFKLGKENNNYHQEKSLLAQGKGISLVHIWEWEWFQKQDILKSLIKLKLGLFDKKIGASKCKIKELDYKEYADFCNKNHLQGEAGARVKLGLFCKNELVQIMSFGIPRFSSNFDWEIIRECSKLGYIVIGGKEKLWSYFMKHYSPRNCISYCDFSKFTGESYLKLGFKKERLNKPGFWWWDNKHNQIYWRNPYQNKELEAKNYLKIYDCGQLVFTWQSNF